MERRLTNEHIEQLFAFTKKHLVEHYDVQVELVDHLANAIEDQWKANPNISFEDALEKEFKKFGVFGFTGLVEQKQNELHKYYNKKMWKEIVQFVSIPKIILTVCLYFILYNFLKSFQPWSEIVLYVLLLIGFIYMIVDGFRFIYQMKKQQKQTQRSWLIQSVASQVYSMPTIGFVPVYIQFFLDTDSGVMSLAYLHFLTAFCLFHFIGFYILIFKLKPALKSEISKTENKYQLV